MVTVSNRSIIRRHKKAMLAGVLSCLLAALFGACEPIDCIPTVTTAKDAGVVVAPTVAKSGVLEARLTYDGSKPLSDRKISFTIEPTLIEDPNLGSDETDRKGLATLDLKNRPLKFVEAANKENYEARFAGDGTYCSSSDEAVIDIVRVS